VIEAFPDDATPRWLLRDRDAIYGAPFRRRVASMGIGEVISSPSSPWQNPCAERLIGSIRRECLDHVIVRGERHLRCVLASYTAYYHGARTHLSLAKGRHRSRGHAASGVQAERRGTRTDPDAVGAGDTRGKGGGRGPVSSRLEFVDRPRDARDSSARRGSGYSPTSGSPRPSGQPVAEFL
jgi:hypothetical protein